MFIDATKPLLTPFDKPIMRPLAVGEGGGEDTKPLTLGYVILESLLRTSEGDTGLKQVERYLLAQQFAKPTLPVKVSPTDADLIKKAIEVTFRHSVQVVGQAWVMIDESPRKLEPAAVADAAE